MLRWFWLQISVTLTASANLIGWAANMVRAKLFTAFAIAVIAVAMLGWTAAAAADHEAQEPTRASINQRLTISELDAIRRQIEACWNIPAGARDAENLIVDISVVMNPDGTVQRAEIIDRSRLTGDPFYRAVAASALRAVLHPRCSPLTLPPQKYQQWRRFTLSFNPKGLIGN